MSYEPTIRPLEQINAWFKKGFYPKAIHFWDTFFSFWHKNDTIPLDSVGGLHERLNNKYDKSDGVALENRVGEDEGRLDVHDNHIDNIYKDIAEHEDRLDNHDGDIQQLRVDMASGDTQTLASAKEYTDVREAAIIAEVERKDEAVLRNSKDYTDGRETAIMRAVDIKDGETLQAAKEHTAEREVAILAAVDNKDSAVLRNAKTYTDGRENEIMATVGRKDAETLQSAQDYTDIREAAILASADTKDRAILNSAKAYTDGREVEIQTTVDSKDASTLRSAQEYADSVVAALIDNSPEALDTLQELAAALGNDPNFATTVMAAIGNKVDKVHGKGLSTNDYTDTERTKLAGIAAGANNYIHPNDANTRHVTDAEKAAWNAKETPTAAQEKATTALNSAKAYADSIIRNLVEDAPDTLGTLQELAAALGNDPNFATTVMTAIGNKVDKVQGKGLSKNDYTDADRTKLAGIAAGANNYVHPNDANTRHVTDAEKTAWNAKETPTAAQEKATAALAAAKTYTDNATQAINQLLSVQVTLLNQTLDGNYGQ